MAAGSAFDAQVKAVLHNKLFGKGHKDSNKFDLTTLFEAQVEPHNRDWAKPAGEYLIKWYIQCGALADLMLEINKAVTEPRFEMSVQGVIEGSREGKERKLNGVPILGKPDLYFINDQGAHIIHDWKVNGFCSNSGMSPCPGFYKIRDAYSYADAKPSRGGDMHKDCFPKEHKGIWINTSSTLDYYQESWAAQLSAYSWVLGEAVGSETIGSIDQLVCKPGTGRYPTIRVASHRALLGESFQRAIFEDYLNLWNILHETPFYFFKNMSFKDSADKCAMLDKQSVELYGPQADLTDDERWLLESAG